MSAKLANSDEAHVYCNYCAHYFIKESYVKLGVCYKCTIDLFIDLNITMEQLKNRIKERALEKLK